MHVHIRLGGARDLFMALGIVSNYALGRCCYGRAFRRARHDFFPDETFTSLFGARGLTSAHNFLKAAQFV